MKDRLHEVSGQIAEAYAQVPETEGTAEIDAIISRVRHSRSLSESHLRNI